MNTFFNNLVAAGAKVRQVANGTAVELLGHYFIFTEEEMGLWGFGEIGIVSIPFSTKKPVVIVEKESVVWGKYPDLQYTIPMDGSKYKVYC